MQRAAVLARPNVQGAWLAPVALAALLVAYNNLLWALPERFAYPPPWLFYPRAVLVPLAFVLWAMRAQGLSLEELGLSARNLWRGVALGLGGGAAVALAAALYFLLASVEYERVADDSQGYFAYWALVRYPLNVAVQEEVLFRGVLLALSVQALGSYRAVALTAAAFALWHVAVDYRTMADTSIADSGALFALAQAGALAALLAGGLILGWMRLHSGGLAAPIAFHWAAVSGMNSALFALSR